MAQDGDQPVTRALGPRCAPMCSERQTAKGVAAEGFCEVHHPQQMRRTEQPKGGRNHASVRSDASIVSPPWRFHIIVRSRQPTALPSAGGCGNVRIQEETYCAG